VSESLLESARVFKDEREKFRVLLEVRKLEQTRGFREQKKE